MVLGMVPAGLLPQARAASDLSYEVSFAKTASGWEYTVTFKGGSPGAGLGNVYFALVPDYSSSGSSFAPSNQIGGAYLNTGLNSVGNIDTNLKTLMGDVSPVAVQTPGDKRYDADGNVTFTGTLTDAYYNEVMNLYTSKPSNFGSSSTDGVPMCVVMGNFANPKYMSGGAAEWKGEAAKAELTATPNSIQFPQGSGTQTVTITLENIGAGTATSISTAKTGSVVGMVLQPSATTLASGATTTFNVVVNVATAGTDTVTVTYNDGSATQTLTIPVEVYALGSMKANPIVINTSGGTGSTNLTGTASPMKKILKVYGTPTVTGPFSYDSSSGINTYVNAQAALTLSGTAYTLTDGMKVIHDGSSSPSTTQAEYDSDVAASNPTYPHADGWVTFQYTVDNANNTNNGNATKYTMKIPVYFINAVPEYTVTFNGNGNTGGSAPASQTVTQGSSITLPAKGTLVKTGYTFLGWGNAAGDTSATAGAAGASYTPSGNVTLYAIWEQNKYTVTFNGNATTGQTVTGVPSALTNVGYGTTISQPTAPTSTGYTFGGWFKEASCTNAWNFATDTVTGNTTLYAKWTKDEYTITFDANNGAWGSGSSAQTTQTKTTVNGKTTAPTTNPTRPGYSFVGWYDTAATTGGSLFSTGTVHTSATTYYARWNIEQLQLSDVTLEGTVGAQMNDTDSPSTKPTSPSPSGDTYTYEIQLGGSWVTSGNYTYTTPGGTSIVVHLTANANGSFTGTTSDNIPVDGIDFNVPIRVKSNADNTNVATAKLYVQSPAPPKVTGATAHTSASDGAFTPGSTVTLDTITLGASTKPGVPPAGSNSASTLVTPGKVTITWHIGGGGSDSNPGLTLGGSGVTSNALPNIDGAEVWVRLVGNGTDVHTEPKWVKLGQIGKKTQSFTVKLVDTAGNDLTGTAGLSAAGGGALGASETGAVSSVCTSSAYEFKGWAYNSATGTPTLTDNTYFQNVTNGSGLYTADFVMPSTLPGAAVTVYAVYKAKDTYTLTVTKDAGISGVTVTVNGTAKSPDTAGGNTYSGILPTDTVVVTSTAGTGYSCDGFTPAASTAAIDKVNATDSSFILKLKANGTVHAKAKANPPALSLSPTLGSGNEDNGTVTAPTVVITNGGGSTATITSVTLGQVKKDGVDDNTHTFAKSGITDGTTTVTVSGAGSSATLVLTPSASGKWPAGTYTVPVTVKYKGSDNVERTATTTATYVVSATTKFDGSVTVKLDGAAKSGATVALAGVTGTQTTAADGKASFTGLSIGSGYAITVTVNGQTVAVSGITVNSTTPDVTVELVTINAQLANTSVEQAAVGKTPSVAGKSVTVKVGDKTVTVNAANVDNTSRPTATKIVQKNSYVALDAVLNVVTGYTFDKWSNGSTTVATTPTYNVQATAGATYVAYLKKSAQVALTYDPNVAGIPDHATLPAIGVPATEMVDQGGTATVSSMVPTLGGYVFTGWKDNGGTAYAAGTSITMNNNMTLFAQWKKATMTITAAPSKGVYGTGYSYTVTATRDDGVAGFEYSISSGTLPGGLTLDTATGQIYGIPYEVGTFNIKIKVQPKAGTSYRASSDATKFEAETAQLSLVVDPAQPTITGVSPVGTVVSGAALNSVGWTVTVAGPRYKGTPAAGASTAADWDMAYTDTISYPVNVTTPNGKTGGLGQATLTSTGSQFAAAPAASTAVHVKFEPLAAPTSGDFDTANKGNKQNKVWKIHEIDTTINHNGDEPKLEVAPGAGASTGFNNVQSWLFAVNDAAHSPAHKGYGATTPAGGTGYVTAGAGTTADTVDTKSFTIKNTGTKETGTLTYTWTSNSNPAFTHTGTTATIPAGGTRALTISVPTGLDVGTHTGTLTITGANGSSATINVTFVVTDPKTFDASIQVDKQGTGDTSKLTKQQIPTGLGLKLVPSDTANATITVDASHWDSTAKVYKVPGLVAGETYRLIATGLSGGNYGGVSGQYDTGATVSATATGATATYFQIATGKAPSDLVLGSAQSGAGWYVDGQYATLDTPATGSKGSDTYDFKNWTQGGNTHGGPQANVPVTAGNVTYTANYTIRAAGTSTVTYKDNKTASGGADVAVITVTNGDPHTVISAQPSWDGYIFKGWNTDKDMTSGTNYAAGDTMTAVTVQTNPTLYAKWEKAAIDNNWGPGAKNGMYGVPFSFTVPTPSTTDGAGVTLTATGLPGGLSFDAATGMISGTPYDVGAYTVTVTATHNYWDGSDADHSAAVTKTYTLTGTIEKYTPVLSGLTVSKVTAGAAYSTATYTGVVTAPLLTTKGATAADDKWTTTSWDVGYNPALVANTQGVLAPTAPSTTFTAAGGTVAMTHTPDNAKTDANNAVYNTVYNNATGSVNASLTETYTMTVQTTPAGGSPVGTPGASASHDFQTAKVTYTNNGTPANGAMNTTNNTVSAQTFTLANTGNQGTGDLTLTWGSSNGSTSDFFTLDPTSFSALAAGGSTTFTIVPKTGLSVAATAYSDTLTIKNANGYSVTVNVTFKVADPDTYTVTINTDHWNVGDTTGTRKNLTAGDVVLVQTDAASSTVTLSGTTGVYTGSAVYGKNYYVEVNGYRVPNLVISTANDEATVDLRQVTIKDDPTAGVTSASTVSKSYVVTGETVTVTYGTANAADNYSFKELQDITAGDPGPVKATGGSTYSQAITTATAFKAIWQKADAQYTLTYDLNGGTPAATNPVPDPLTETYTATNNVAALKNCNATNSGKVFLGWDTNASATTPTYVPGSSITLTGDVTVYAIWKENDGMSLPDNGWTVAYKDALGDKVINAVGGIPGYTYAGSMSGTDFTFDTTGHKFSGTANTYQDGGNNTYTANITVTDSATPTAGTAQGTFTVTVTKALTEVKTGFTVPGTYRPLPGEPLDFTKLDSSALEVVAKKTDGVTDNPNVTFDETPTGSSGTAGTGDDGGSWRVVGSTPDPTDPNKVTYTLEFTPKDPGFLPCQTTVTIEHEAKKIATAEVTITFPASATGGVVYTGSVSAATSTDQANQPATAGDVSIVKDSQNHDVSWTSGVKTDGTFDPTDDITVYVVIKPENDWIFKTKAEDGGDVTVTLKDAVTGATVTGTVIGCTENGATVTYTWPKEDQKATNIQDQVTKPVDGSNPIFTALPIGSPVGSHTTTTDVKWYHGELSAVTSANWNTLTGMTSGDTFTATAPNNKYVAIVTADVVSGYYFDKASLAALDGSNAYAQIRGDLESFQNAKVLSVTDMDGDSTRAKQVVIAVEFTAEASKVVGLNSATGPLVYYAQTPTHIANTVTGHKAGYDFTLDKNDFTVNTVNSLGTTATTDKFALFVDKNGDGKYDSGDTVLVKYTADGSQDTYAFRNVYGASANLTGGTGLDGAELWAVTVADDGTMSTDAQNATRVGTLTVKELRADRISSVGGDVKLSYTTTTGSAAFAVTAHPTANVVFNVDAPMSNTVSGMSYVAYSAASAGSNTYFYEMGNTGAPAFVAHDAVTGAVATGALLTELTVGADVQSGKTLYMTYVDKNNNVVRTPLGVFNIDGQLTADFTDENGHEPEYGDKLTAKPEGGKGPYTYVWEYEDTDGSWKPITGPDGQPVTTPDYTPGKDDVGKKVHVVITDGGGQTATSREDVIEKRSLQFTVKPQNKNADGSNANVHAYIPGDFTPTRVLTELQADGTTFLPSAPAYGGVVNGDTVTITPGNWNGGPVPVRPPYLDTDGNGDDTDPGSEITWPKVLTGGTNAGGLGNYTLDQDDYYRLVPQDKQENRGVITGSNGVIHVDVYLNGPVNGGSPAPNPVGVDSLTETTASNGGIDLTDFGLTWYEVPDGGTFDVTNPGTAHTANFGPNKTYAVVVPVKPATGKRFTEDTEFYFHFDSESRNPLTLGSTTGSGVWKNGDNYYMFYTFAPTKASDVPTLTGITATPLTNTLYYVTTDPGKNPGHKEADRANAPGDKSSVPFAFNTAGVTVMATTITGSTVSNPTTVTPSRFYLLDKNSSNAQVTLTNGTTIFTDDAYDGCEVYVEYTAGGVTKNAYVGTLTIRELTAERITPDISTSGVKLSYSVGDMTLDLSGVTGAAVNFNRDTAQINTTYNTNDGLAYADNANKGVTKYYYEISKDGGSFAPIDNGATLTAAHNGMTVYICYTDVNEHTVRAAIGTLAVNDENGSTAAIRLENQTHANEDTQYGDALRVFASGVTGTIADGTLKYTWQISNDGSTGWTDLDASMTNTTTENWDAEKYVGKYVRVILTQDGGKTVTDASGNPLIVSNVLKIEPKKITIRYSWVTGSKMYDATPDVPDFATTVVYDAQDFQSQLVARDVGIITPNTLNSTTGAVFQDTTGAVGDNKPIDLTFSTTDELVTTNTTDNPISNYVVEVVEPKGTITARVLTWDDFEFVGKVKRYDGTKTVYRDDNYNLTAENGTAYTGAIGAAEGLWSVKSSITGDLKTAIEAAITAAAEYASANSLEPREDPVANAGEKPDGHSVLQVQLSSNSTNFTVPTGVFLVKNSAINPKQVTVGTADIDWSGSIASTVTEIELHGKVNNNKLVTADQSQTPAKGPFQVAGSVTPPAVGATTTTVTVIGVTQGQSDGIYWQDNNYKLVWDGDKTGTKGITGGAPTKVEMGATEIVYGDPYSEIKPFTATVTYDSGDSENLTNQTFSDLSAKGITAVVAHDVTSNSTLTYSVVTNSLLAGWDTASGTTASVTVKFFDANTVAANASAADLADAWNKANLGTATILVTQRELNVKPTWNLAMGGETGKIYDAKANALGAMTKASDKTAATGAMDYTAADAYGNKAFAADQVQVNTAGDYSATFADANAGDNKSITVTLNSTAPFTGTHANRYKKGTVALAQGNIKPRPATIKFDEPSVPLNSSTSVALKGVLVEPDGTTPLGTGETVSVGTDGTYATTAQIMTAGTAPAVDNVTVTKGAISNPNYVVTWPATINGSVTPLDIGNVAVTYKQPEKNKLPTANDYKDPLTYSNTTEVDIAATSGTAWHEGKLDSTTAVAATGYEAGKYYVVTATVTAKDGYQFTENTKFTANDTTTTNGNVVADKMKVVLSADKKTATVQYVFKVEDDSDILQHVNLAVTAPATNNTPANTAAATSVYTDTGTSVPPANGLASATPNVEWKVQNGANWDSFTGAFQAGKVYQATIKDVKAGIGWKFANDVDFTANGSSATQGGNTAATLPSGVTSVSVGNVKADGSYDVVVVFDATADKPDMDVWGYVTHEPVAGEQTSQSPISEIDTRYDIYNNDVNWYTSQSNAENKVSPMAATDTFQAGQTYYARITVKLTADAAKTYQFKADTKGWINDGTNATTVKYDAANDTITLIRPFEVGKEKVSIHAGDKTQTGGQGTIPEAGAVVADVNAKAGIHFDNNKEDSVKYTLSGTAWFTDIDGSTPATSFEPGKTYYLVTTATVTDAAKYELKTEPTDHFWVDNNSQTAAKVQEVGSGTGKYKISFRYYVPEPGEITVIPGFAAQPVRGEKLSDIYTDDNFNVVSIQWTKEDGTAVAVGTVAEADTKYTATITVTPKASVKVSGDPTYTFNTKATYETGAAAANDPNFIKHEPSGSNYVLSYVFETTGKKQVSSIPGYAGVPEIDKALGDIWTDTENFTEVKTQWTEAGTDVGETAVAKPETVYTASITVTPKPGIEVTENYFFNGVKNPGDGWVEAKKNDDGSYTLIYQWKTPKKTETPVVEPVPIPGFAKAPEIDVRLGDIWTDSNFEEISSQWKKGDADVSESTKAEAESVYTATIVVKPKAGVTVKEEYFFNGNPETDQDFIDYKKNDDGTYTLTYRFRTPKQEINQTVVSGGGGGTTIIETPVVTYALRDLGVTLDLTAEKVQKNKNPKAVPKVDGIEGLKFVGWSETDPATLKDGKLPTLVDPTTFKITDDKTFYAVYEKLAQDFDHTHYVIGFPDGTFGPDHQITRGQVATIIARSCLENFIEGGSYGNPGNYTDVESHWAFSAISYCSMNGVFTGYGDGTFRPDQYITRQELATVVARLAGVQVSQGLPFSDSADIAAWAVNGVYTNYANGWVNGYTDGTFKPLNDISRAETVKIFNGYLSRGTDKEGLSELREYVHSGVASNNQENGKDEYMTWPDVAKTHWAYYEIIEAANDHNFHWRDLEKEIPPEDWYECYIDEVWRYQDDANDGADDVGRQDTLPILTVTYVVQSNGVIWDSITEEVTQYSSPSVEKLPQAVPSEGYRFAGWSETDPDTGVISLIDPTAHPVLENKTFYAVFEREVPAEMPKVTITYVIGEHGSTDMALTETIDMWQSPTVENLPKITAHEGWRFAGWSETDPAAGTVTPTDPTDHPALADSVFYALYEQEGAVQQPDETQQPDEGQTPDETQQPDEGQTPDETQQPDEGQTPDGTQQPDEGQTPDGTQQPDEGQTPDGTQQPDVGQTPDETQQPDEGQDTEGAEYARYRYINGYTDNTFRPDDAFTRAAVATVIAGLKGYDANVTYAGGEFDDLSGHWGANAIAFCVSQGLMSGYTDNTFRPDNAISRQEFAIVLTRLAGETESGELPFTDVDSIAPWAVDSVYTAYSKGWIGGYSEGTFLPERNVTRAEAVKMFNGYLGRTADRESIESQTGYTVWEDVPETHWAYFEIIEASNNWAK